MSSTPGSEVLMTNSGISLSGKKRMILLFQVNSNVQEESNLYEDILLQDFVESYNNLTIKSLLMVKFAQEGFVPSDFVFKAGLQF